MFTSLRNRLKGRMNGSPKQSEEAYSYDDLLRSLIRKAIEDVETHDRVVVRLPGAISDNVRISLLISLSDILWRYGMLLENTTRNTFVFSADIHSNSRDKEMS